MHMFMISLCYFLKSVAAIFWTIWGAIKLSTEGSSKVFICKCEISCFESMTTKAQLLHKIILKSCLDICIV